MRCTIAAGALALILSAPVVAQEERSHPNNPLPPPVDFNLDSGALPNPGLKPLVVFDQVVNRPGAEWMRLYFSDATQLPPGSYIQVTSLLDGESQTLDAGTLAMWNHTTAYFNGDSLRVQLIDAAGA